MIKHLHDYCLNDSLDNLEHDLSDQQAEDWVELETDMKTLFTMHLLKAPASVLGNIAKLENPCQHSSAQE